MEGSLVVDLPDDAMKIMVDRVGQAISVAKLSFSAVS
jgi:hypothetical protein